MGAAFATLLGLAFRGGLLGEGLINLSYDLPFYFRPDIKVDDVLVLYMDLPTHKNLHLERFGQRWNRDVHAKLLRRLAAYHARTVVFDVFFMGESVENPAADYELAQAAKEHGNVVVASMVHYEEFEGRPIGLQLLAPYTNLAEVASIGVVAEGEENTFIRKDYSFDGFNEPSLAWKAAQISVPNRLPEPSRERWLNYYGPPGSLPHESVYRVFDTTNALSPSTFSNKVVFVGALYSVAYTGGKGTDDFNTPYSRWRQKKSPGVEINATAYVNLVRGDWLSRLSWPAEWALLLLMGGIFGIGLSFCSPIRAVVLAVVGALVFLVISIWSVWQTQVWFCWLIVPVVQIPAALAWSVGAHVRYLHGEKKSLEQALAIISKGEGRPEPATPGGPRTPDSTPPTPEVMWERITGSPLSTPLPSPSGAVVLTPAPPAPPAPAIPDHELLRCFGKGAYGEVWLARDIIGSFHAVKIVHRHRFEDARPLEREFKGIRRFTPISRSHPGFVNVLHVGRNENAGYFYYVMELGDDLNTGQEIDPEKYIPKTLATELQRRPRFPMTECLEVAIQLADALEYLHQQHLIHRDIKPSNIIFVKGAPKFADIGLVTDIATKGNDVSYLGTPGRIPPEGPGAPPSDVYSLGKVLYEMGFGLGLLRFPELPTDLIQSADGAQLFKLNRIVLRACDPDVRHRFQTAAELRAQLVALQQSVKSD